ncbi:glycosyltransferase family 4 protein [Luteolibacter pohnpeiensis]|uniref:Glycosyltransferase family 4 protein n=1 Tax=Luteolibacter pohnpeiensis TaxID=454153 RepID=A0A934S6Z3_9BACT|nr:glycosyltransferase family 1 protein [Luteolibacter pohnpeiensis]MBK1882420.1 glycosyltransferase family 4 protein [Luteolibacter pohnpeiensis]
MEGWCALKVLLSAGMIQGGRSGVGRYVICLAEAMVKEQPQVELFIAGFDQDRGLFPWIDQSHWVSIPEKMSGGAQNLLWHQLSLGNIAKHLGADLLHIPSYRRMLIQSPVPQVATIHDCAPFVLRDKYDFARGFFGRVLVPWIARRVPEIIAVSETTGSDIVHFMKVAKEQVTVIPNGMDHTMFRILNEDAIQAFKKRKGLEQPFFLYVARLEHPAKNHLRLINAFEKLIENDGFSGQLVLPGAPWHGSEVIEEAVRSSPHRERIRLEGFVDNDDLPLWYAAAEALVFPSLMEGFGLPLLEAQACGTRIACANSTSLPEVAGPAGLLFDGLDEESIYESMKTLAEMSPEERLQKEKAGVEWAAKFTWSAHAEKAVEVYEKLLQREQEKLKS